MPKKPSPLLRLHTLQGSVEIAQVYIDRMCEENYGYITSDNEFVLDFTVCKHPYIRQKKKGGLGLGHAKMDRIQTYFNNIIKRKKITKPNVQYKTINDLTLQLFGRSLQNIQGLRLFTGCSFKPRTIDITPPVELNKFTNLTDAMNFLVTHQDIRKNDTIVVVGVLMAVLMVEEWDVFSDILRSESLRPVVVLQNTSKEEVNFIAKTVNLKIEKLEEIYQRLSDNIWEFNEGENNTTIEVIEAQNLLMDHEQGIFADHHRSVATSPQFFCDNLDKVRLHLYHNSKLSEGVREKLSRYLSPLKIKEDVPLR